jgi:hypothetical protein
MTRPLAVALALASLLGAVPARADDVAEAKARFRRGVELYAERRWAEAIAEFEAAYRRKPHGAIHFNVAQCRERLDDWPGALRSYQDYLREVPAAEDRAAVRAAMGRLEERLARAGVQVLLVYTDPPGARLALDGKERGTSPLHAALAPGSYALEVSLDGFEPVKERVDVPRLGSRLVDVVLRPAARPAPPAATAQPAAEPAPRPASPADLAARPPAEPEKAPIAPPPPRERRRVAAWVTAGAAVVAAAAGAYLGWSAQQDERAIDALPAPDGAAAGAKAKDAEAKARAANALYAVAGGAAAASVTLFAIEGRF